MKNIPVFMSPGGTASLILHEIPHRAVGYVRLLTVRQLDVLLADCAAFCRDCGAGTVLASRGPEPLEGLPHAHDMLLLRAEKASLPPPARPVTLRPMDERNDAIYQRTYNRCFSQVPGALTYDRAEIRRIYDRGQQAFLAVDERENVLGMGELHGSELAAVGVLPEFRGQGTGRELVLSLLERCPGPEIHLTAASVNEAALALYDALGFTVYDCISRWYEV